MEEREMKNKAIEMAKRDGAQVMNLNDVKMPTVAAIARNVIKAQGFYTCTIGGKKTVIVA